ncbi:hypothetical protein GQ600_3271 [Phytophthora cactorum]|nr:hypothetical protein GQ600_3271 [Phytophthora cactorum]
MADQYDSSNYHEAFLIRLPIDEQSRRDRKQLQRIREAVELFTILSRVDNGAFTRLLSKAESADAGGHVIYPDWELRIYGTLSLMTRSMSWGTLLGFHDGPWVNSAEFREASQKLKNMGLEETSQHFHAIDWICQRHRLYITATQKPDTVANAQTFEPLQRMLSIRVPPIVQMCMMPGGTKFELLWKQDIVADTYCLDMDTSYSGSVNFVDITAAVARTAASEISIWRAHARKKAILRQIGSRFDAIENIGMVMDLLKLLFSGLSELSLRHYEAIQIQVDLSVLAAVCPALHELRIQNFNVVVSTIAKRYKPGLLKLFGLTQRIRYRTWCCASKPRPSDDTESRQSGIAGVIKSTT